MRTFNCIIADDEKPARDLLEYFIDQVPGLHLIASFRNASEVLHYLKTNTSDLLFLDITMPGLSGLDMIKMLSNPPQFILTTAYHEFAVQAFELNAVDYLTKPFSQERFQKAVNRFIRMQGPSPIPDSCLPVKINRETIQIPVKNIAYIKANGNYCRIFLVNKTMYITHTTMVAVRDLLPEDAFVQIHRSYIVARQKIFSYTATTLTINDTVLPVGRNYKEKL
jgi:DNA-binding LytR/AlgR family response regulator